MLDGVITKPATYEQLLQRIAALEDVLEELAPFGKCIKIDMVAHFRSRSKDEAESDAINFKRDTFLTDQRTFRKIQKLLANRIT